MGIVVDSNNTKLLVTGVGRANDIPNAAIETTAGNVNYFYVNTNGTKNFNKITPAVAKEIVQQDIDDVFAVDNISTSLPLRFSDNKTLIGSGTATTLADIGNNSIVIGNKGATVVTGQGVNAVAIGVNAGKTGQYIRAVAIGDACGQTSQGKTGGSATAIGFQCGFTDQATGAVALGAYGAGRTSQGAYGVAIGQAAGEVGQNTQSVAIGTNAGREGQGIHSVAIGRLAGSNAQGTSCVAIGVSAGETGQNQRGVAIGEAAGKTNQSQFAVAIGPASGNNTQGDSAIAIGRAAAETTQGSNSIAIGRVAARTNQGNECIAIGTSAGHTNQHNNSIVLNASGATLNTAGASRFYVNPIRPVRDFTTRLNYDPSTREITHTTVHYFQWDRDPNQGSQSVPASPGATGPATPTLRVVTDWSPGGTFGYFDTGGPFVPDPGTGEVTIITSGIYEFSMWMLAADIGGNNRVKLHGELQLFGGGSIRTIGFDKQYALRTSGAINEGSVQVNGVLAEVSSGSIVKVLVDCEGVDCELTYHRLTIRQVG